MGKVIKGAFGYAAKETALAGLPYEDTLFAKKCLDIQKEILDQVYDETYEFLIDHNFNPAMFKIDEEYLNKYLTMNPAKLMKDENYLAALCYLGMIEGTLYRTYTIIKLVERETRLTTILLKKVDGCWFNLIDDKWEKVPYDIFD